MNKGIVECPMCNGAKFLDYKKNKQFKSRLVCHQCEGQGIVFWIDIIFNRKKLKHNIWEIYERVDNSSPIISQELIL